MLSLTVKTIVRTASFWKKGPKLSFEEELEQAAKSANNLAYMVEAIKEKNLNKPKLLPPQLPQHQGKLTVVMEMDEVLSYTFEPDEEGYLLAPLRKYDFYREFEQFEAYLSIYKRKNLDNFLNYLNDECQPVLWSTGVPSYVELVMSLIDPNKCIPYIITQGSCDYVFNQKQDLDVFVKDLNLLGRDLSKVVYIDTKPMSYWMYPDNCYPGQEFKADMTMETEDLNHLILQLESLKKASDVRQVLSQRFQLRQILKSANLL